MSAAQYRPLEWPTAADRRFPAGRARGAIVDGPVEDDKTRLLVFLQDKTAITSLNSRHPAAARAKQHDGGDQRDLRACFLNISKATCRPSVSMDILIRTGPETNSRKRSTT